MIYLELVNINEVGVKKKINYQLKSLKKYFDNVEWVGPKTNENVVVIDSKNYFLSNGTNFYQKIVKKLVMLKILLALKKYKFKDKKLIYIRYFGSSYMFIKFLKKLKSKQIKIIIEIPTYPYDKERKGNFLFFLSDKIYRKKLYKYVDRVVTYSEDKEIWGIPCINISNGIDLDEIKLRNKKEKEKNKIVFTSVSNCSFWHGLDRFLNSLEKYGQQKNKKEIIFNIVGTGDEIDKLRDIVSKSEYLLKVVKFQGFKTGVDLDILYDDTDIGVGSLARHRSGLYSLKTLKNREYCAKGIPMIFSEDDLDLRAVSFVYNVSADENLIDIEKVIKWYEKIDISSEEIRLYAKKFSWDIQIKKIIAEVEKI